MVLFHHIHYFYFSANKHPWCCSKHMKFSLKFFVYYKLADFLSKHEIVWRTGHDWMMVVSSDLLCFLRQDYFGLGCLTFLVWLTSCFVEWLMHRTCVSMITIKLNRIAFSNTVLFVMNLALAKYQSWILMAHRLFCIIFTSFIKFCTPAKVAI